MLTWVLMDVGKVSVNESSVVGSIIAQSIEISQGRFVVPAKRA